MILSSHIIVASAVVAPLLAKPLDFANAVFIFIISFLSHYAIDAIPHWDYKLFSIEELPSGDKKIVATKISVLKDLFKNSADGIIGLIGAIFIIGIPDNLEKFFAFCLIIIGGILPDFLELCYVVFNKFPLNIFHKIHIFIHGKRIFKNKPILGIISQILTLIIIFVLFQVIYN
ncbi:MAG: hypothetical protein AAB396_00765 [Patescibacteria group bacterium]